jgi:putative oxidoreductase
MWVAVFIIHADDPFGKQEFGLLYLIPYLTLYFTGPGKLSLDKQLG